MSTTIDRLLSDEELRQTLSEKARNRARDFSWDETAAQTLEVIKDVAWSARNLGDAAGLDMTQKPG